MKLIITSALTIVSTTQVMRQQKPLPTDGEIIPGYYGKLIDFAEGLSTSDIIVPETGLTLKFGKF